VTRRDRYLWLTYGITQEDYDAILEAQGGTCALCRRPPRDDKNLHVDHEHVFGWDRMPPEERRRYVRGLVDYNCNKFKIGRTTLQGAKAVYDYLRRPPARAVLRRKK